MRGKWNDYPKKNKVDGYLVEFGGMVGVRYEQPPLNASVTITPHIVRCQASTRGWYDTFFGDDVRRVKVQAVKHVTDSKHPLVYSWVLPPASSS